MPFYIYSGISTLASPNPCRLYSPFSALNLSQLSLSVENTMAAIMRTSVLASWGSCGGTNTVSQHSLVTQFKGVRESWQACAPDQTPNLPCQDASSRSPSCIQS